jgi:general stress protein CsbA
MGSILTFPFRLLWAIVRTILNLTGRFVAVLLGIVLVVAGVALSLTIVGAIIGVPMVIIGAGLILKGIFG